MGRMSDRGTVLLVGGQIMRDQLYWYRITQNYAMLPDTVLPLTIITISIMAPFFTREVVAVVVVVAAAVVVVVVVVVVAA